MNPFVTFNINDYVQVRLTEHGRACLRKQYYELAVAYKGNPPFAYSPPKEVDGWSRWQAWELMRDLGPHFSHGGDVPFETTIRIENTK